MKKTLAIVGAFALAIILSASLCITPGSGRSAHAEDYESKDAAIAESNLAFVAASLATVIGIAVIAKRHIISKIR